MQRSLKGVAGRWARLAAAASLGAVATLSLPGVASAGTGNVVSSDVITKVFNNAENKDGLRTYQTVRLIKFRPTGGSATLVAYCVDLRHGLGEAEDTYEEVPGGVSGLTGQARLLAILNLSLPAKNAGEVAKAAKIQKPGGMSDAAFQDAIYAGTQTAIWSAVFQGKFKLATLDEVKTHLDTVANAAKNLGVTADNKAEYLQRYEILSTVSEYLLKATVNPAAPALSIAPATATAQVGQKAGPFTLTATNVSEVALKSTGGALVDKDNKPITTLADGAQFWVDCKAEGTVKIEATATFNVPVVALFDGESAQVREAALPTAPTALRTANKLQKIIVVQPTPKKLAASAAASCTAKPGLPVTGAPVAGTVTAGLVLLGTGVGLFLMRRRRIQFTV